MHILKVIYKGLWLEYGQMKGFSSPAGAKLFKTQVWLTEAEAELLKSKFG